jgi:CheY-like chemotaxis protein
VRHDSCHASSAASRRTHELDGSKPIVISGRGACRILIIDDDAGLRGALLAILVGNPRYTVQAATDGHDGLARIGTFRPHLVLLDLRMPGLDGADLCRAVKADPATRAARILAMSALPEDEARERMLAAGADAFLAKPFTLPQLEIEMARLL